jgi:methionyl-tRNA formyltransferase
LTVKTYKEVLKNIRVASTLVEFNRVEDSKYGPAFNFAFNDKILEINLKSEKGFRSKDNELYLDQVEKNRNKFIEEYKEPSLYLAFFIVNNLIIIAYSQKDLRFINTTLKILDKIKSEGWCSKAISQICNNLVAMIKEICIDLIGSFVKDNQCMSDGKFTNRILSQPNKLQIETASSTNKGIVVFSPNPYSLYTLSVLHLLRENGLKVEAVIVRRIFNISRIRKELARDGTRLLKKIIRKLVFRDSQRTYENARNLSDVRQELNISNKNIMSWCKEFSVPLIACDTINDRVIINKLREIMPDYGIFTGGGIVSNDVLNLFSQGVLNCHAGILPHYRGMDVIEWPIILGDKNNIGATVHFMSKDVDMGDMLYGYRMERNLGALSARMEIESFFPYLQVYSLVQHLSGKVQVETQKNDDGVNYYVMHHWMFNQVVGILNNNF